MFGRFFSARPAPKAAPVPRVPAGRRIYAIGDIHGRADSLDALHALIRDDAAGHPDQAKAIIYVGDYVDRGPDSRKVIDIVQHPQLDGFEVVQLLGNHEDSLLKFLDDTGIGPAWMAYGGVATLYSYGVRPPESAGGVAELERAQRDLKEKIPADHVAFMRTLKVTHIEGDYLFVHAGLAPNVPLDRQDVQDMIWIRDEFLMSNADFGKIVVHGHSITDMPEVRHNRIGIDTGAFATGRLTCLVLQDDTRAFLAT